MMDEDKQFLEYYITNKYRGFCKLTDEIDRLSFSTQLTFSNGHNQISASGNFREDALKSIFAKIDEFHTLDKPSPIINRIAKIL